MKTGMKKRSGSAPIAFRISRVSQHHPAKDDLLLTGTRFEIRAFSHVLENRTHGVTMWQCTRIL